MLVAIAAEVFNTSMGDDSSRADKSLVNSLKNEWSLFWESISGEEDEEQNGEKLDGREDPFVTGKLSILTLAQIRAMTKALSQDRKRLHQKLESLHKELELNTAKLESLRLVGGQDEETIQRINELNDIGQTISDELAKLDSRLKLARDKEIEITQKDQEI